MGKRTFTKRVLLLEGIGFGLVVILLWLNELLDLPHRLLAAPETPLNWRESVLESALVLVLAAATLSWTHRALAKIRHLEGFLRICMICKRVNARDEWVPIDMYISDHSEAILSHSLCPECKEKHYPTLMKQK